MAYFNYEIIDQFDWNERLWLLGDVVAAQGDANAELGDDAIDAAKWIKDFPKLEQMRMIYGISMLKLSEDYSPTSKKLIIDYSDCDCAIECGVTWGDYLEDLSFNDALWILHQAIYSTVNAAKLVHRDDLDALAEGIENGALSADDLRLLGYQLAESLAYECY
ncbi:MAG: hypothetical protein HC907_14975 [Richelia sp. SM1_7_0]|nr:hypothetical protein [Richelia sp. SM1_7_0]